MKKLFNLGVEPKSEEDLSNTHDKQVILNSLEEKRHEDGDDSFGLHVELFTAKPGRDEPALINTQFQGIKTIIKGIPVDDVNLLSEYADQHGCYVFRDKKGNAIYVGEGKDIYKRIRAHLMGTYRKSTTYEIKIKWPEHPKKKNKNDIEPLRDSEGKIIYEVFTEYPYKFFWTVDIYCLNGLDVLFARKYLEQLLFYTENPIHNKYTEENKANKKFDDKIGISLKYINYLQKAEKNPKIDTLRLPTTKEIIKAQNKKLEERWKSKN